ncbi:MAG: FAD:protein FMN transferase [Bdellovibrionota bacterium]|nr:FAD:protein FMN transferase [Bdellovibrionota bacterium]
MKHLNRVILESLRKSLGFFFIRILILSSVFSFLGCKKEAQKPLGLFGKTMGTTYTIRYFPEGLKGGKGPQEVKILIDDLLKKINQEMSTYIPDSELSLINSSNKFETWHNLSPRLFKVLKEAKGIYQMTDGAFDVTVGPLVNLWGFGPKGERKVPSKQALKKVRKSVGYHHVQMKDSEKILKSKEGVYIDLSAIAKGFAVDEVSSLLTRLGFKDHMVEIGGEIKTSGDKRGQLWRLAISNPSAIGQSIHKVIGVKSLSMATSGNYRNYFTSKGKFFSHTIDPKTGYPVKHRLISVTVFDSFSCMKADALATALMVMGHKKGVQFAEKHGLLAYFIAAPENETDNGKRGALVKKASTQLKLLLSDYFN